MDLFKITAAVMHWGNQKWKQKPREEQAEPDGTDEITKVNTLLGLELDSFIMGLLKPKIKVKYNKIPSSNSFFLIHTFNIGR